MTNDKHGKMYLARWVGLPYVAPRYPEQKRLENAYERVHCE